MILLNFEYCDPFCDNDISIWIKLEHCARYLFACDFLRGEAKTIADISCANGYGSAILAEHFNHVFAVDRNEQYLSSTHLNKNNITPMYIDLDSEDLGSILGPVDAIVSFETIEHLKMPFTFLKCAHDILNKEGWLLLSFPNANYEKINNDGTNNNPYHLHTFSVKNIIHILRRNGFDIEDVLGQPVSNSLYISQQDFLSHNEDIGDTDINKLFRHDDKSIRTLSRLFAYPEGKYTTIYDIEKYGYKKVFSPGIANNNNIHDIRNSYSYIIVARKKV